MLSPSSSDLLPGLLVAKRNEKSENTEHLLTQSFLELEQKTVWNKGSMDIAEPQEDIQEGADYHVNFQDSLLDSIHFSY